MCISVFFSFLIIVYLQIDSMLLRVCSVIDHRGHQNVVKTSVTHLPVACVPLFCLEVSRYPAAGNCFQKTRYPEVRNFDQFSQNSLFNSSKNIRYLFSSLK